MINANQVVDDKNMFRSALTGLLLSLVVCVQGATWDDSYNQMNATLTGYDSRHRPVLDQSQSLQVNVSFDLVAIQEFDEVNEKFSVVGVIYLTWIDEKLVWNPFAYDGLWSQMYKAKDVWYPIMILANPYVEVEDFVDDWMTIRIFPNGYAFFAPGSVFKSTCSVDVTYYPFDTQVFIFPCSLSAKSLRCFTCLHYKSFEHTVFLPVWRTFCHFYQI